MKKCPYCSAEYPDDATECAIDRTPLKPGIDRKKITGVWRGVFGYAVRTGGEGMKLVSFTLKLEQGWTSHFSGSVTEDTPSGPSEVGTIDGYFSSPTIDFTKRMPVAHIIEPDGTRRPLSDALVSIGHTSNQQLPSPAILYNGSFLDSRRVQGTWMLTSVQIPLPGGISFSTGQATGYWCAEFITGDLEADPTAGPTSALFDKDMLTPAEVERVEGTPYQFLGKFNVPDAQKAMDLFTHLGLRFNLQGNDDAMQQMMPFTQVTGGYSGAAEQIEIFVHPVDERHAKEILFGNTQADVEPS